MQVPGPCDEFYDGPSVLSGELVYNGGGSARRAVHATWATGPERQVTRAAHVFLIAQQRAKRAERLKHRVGLLGDDAPRDLPVLLRGPDGVFGSSAEPRPSCLPSSNFKTYHSM